MLKKFISVFLFITSTEIYAMNIVTIEQDPTNCLSTKAAAIPMTKEGLADAAKIVNQMKDTLLPLMPAAGLAAPQIGISKQAFIFSWDRTPEHLEYVLNPSFKPIGNEMVEGWEACFSAMIVGGKSHAAFLKRYKKIEVTYSDLEGKTHNRILEDYAAKVFQHEYDHLQGIVCVKKEGSKTKTFDSKEEMTKFMIETKKKESTTYNNYGS